MGRVKKNAAAADKPPKSAAAANKALQRQLEEVQGQLSQLHLEGDAERIGTSMQIAGLSQQLWSLRSLLAENTDAALACSRQAAAWGEQHVRAAKAITTDLLRDLWERSEEMQRHQGALKGLR